MQTSKDISKGAGTELEERQGLSKLLLGSNNGDRNWNAPHFHPPEEVSSQTFKNYTHSLSPSYRHYSKNLYMLLDDTTEMQERYVTSSTFKADYLFTSLSLTENVQIVKKTIIPDMNRSARQSMRFYIKTLDEETGSVDPFQSQDFSAELLTSSGLTFTYTPEKNDTESTSPRHGSFYRPCGELTDQAFSDFDDKFMIISFRTIESTVNLGNLRNLKNKYQIFNSGGVLLYEMAKLWSWGKRDARDQEVIIFDTKEEEVGQINLKVDALNTLNATITFGTKIRPKEKLLIMGAVFIILGKTTWGQDRQVSRDPQCSMGSFMGFVLKKFCTAG